MDLSIVPEHSFCVLRGLGQRPNKHETGGLRVNGIRLFSQSGTAQERVETMLPHMMEVAGATEELKARNPMRWAGLMNTLKAQVEEVLLQELVYI